MSLLIDAIKDFLPKGKDEKSESDANISKIDLLKRNVAYMERDLDYMRKELQIKMDEENVKQVKRLVINQPLPPQAQASPEMLRPQRMPQPPQPQPQMQQPMQTAVRQQSQQPEQEPEVAIEDIIVEIYRQQISMQKDIKYILQLLIK